MFWDILFCYFVFNLVLDHLGSHKMLIIIPISSFTVIILASFFENNHMARIAIWFVACRIKKVVKAALYMYEGVSKSSCTDAITF